MSNNNKTIKSVNDSGNLLFDGNAGFITNCTNFVVNSRKDDNNFGTASFNIEADANSSLHTTTGNIEVKTSTDIINIISNKTNSNNSIYLQSLQSGGGIKFHSDTGGITSTSTGNIDINSQNADINIGVFAQGSPTDQTNNIIMEANDNITTSSTDFTVIASDTLSLISLTGDISLGSTLGSSVIKFENDNLLINQTTSTLDKQLDIKITDEASSSPGYNGIVVNSSNSQVASDITLQTSDSNAIISLGVQPESSKFSYLTEYIAQQSGTVITPIDGPEFTNADIGKRIYWSSQDETDTITGLNKLIMSASNTYATSTLTTSGTYTGTTSKLYKIEIDKTGTPDTFRWSNDAGATYQTTFKPITAGAISLENGVSITFTSTTGHVVGDYWTFHTKITANVSVSRTITNSEKMYILQEFTGYLKTSNISDIQFKTSDNEKMRITSDGSIGIGTNKPTSTLEITNNIGTGSLVNDYDTNYQINPHTDKLKSGGYVVVWESKIQDGDDYGIYGQQFTSDGAKFNSQFKVNITTSGHQSNPHIAHRNISKSRDYIVVWMSEESDGSGVYDIYAQVYVNGTNIKSSDIFVNSSTSTNKQLYPRAVGLTDGTYLVVWASDDNNNGEYNIYGKIVNNSGNVVGSRFQLTSTSDSYSVSYPYPFAISDNDTTIPGGYGVVFMNEYDSQNTSGSSVSDDNRYNIQYRIFNSSGTAQISDTDITDSTGNRLTISDGLVSAVGLENGGFALSFYRNYEGKGSLYTSGDRVEGLSSGVTNGTISSVSGNILTLTGLSSTDKYLVGEEILIENFWREKIEKVSHDGGGGATITLSKGHKSITMYKYSTASTTPQLSDITVNTNELLQDSYRYNLSGIDLIRNNTIFSARRPMAPITELVDGTLAISWTNGSIPSIYYQLINSTSGALIGTETQIQSIYTDIKQRNVLISGINTYEGKDAGFSVVWDVEILDTNESGIYGTIINPNNSMLRVHNLNTEFSVKNDGKVGIGIEDPDDDLHIKSSKTTSNIIIQNTNSLLNPTTGTHNIRFQDNYTDLGIIKSGYSNNYQKLNPQFDYLLAYYPFDGSSGDNSLVDNSINKYDGRLENFNVYTDWKTGKINKCLEFNGSNNYVSLGVVSAINNLGQSSDGYTLTSWVKIPENITSGANLDIISNGGTLTDVGNFNMTLSDISSNGGAFLTSSLTTANGVMNVEGRGSSLSDNEWHFVSTVYHTSNTKLQTFVDGIQNNIITVSGSVSSSPTSNTFIGSRNSTSGYFNGFMDEMRIYNKALTTSEIEKIYSYGNEKKGKIVLTTQRGTNNLTDGIIIDDTGSIQCLSAKANTFKRLTGTLTFSGSSTTVSGSGTNFLNELQVGDTIKYSSTSLVVSSIENNTSMTVNSSSSSSSTNKVIRKPSIITGFDINDNVKFISDYQGNTIYGGYSPSSKLELYGTGDTGDLPYLTLTNSTAENTEGGRETRVNFRGVLSGSEHTLGYIDVSHNGTSADTKGKMRFYVNNGTETREAMVITNDGNVAIGNQVSPLGIFHISDTEDCEVILSSGSDAELVYGETSKLYFTGSNSIGDNPSGLMNSALSMIRGSSDSNSINVDGRLDFYTNNNVDDLGLQNRMSITTDGYVGVNVSEPTQIFQVSPKHSLPTDTTGSQSSSTITLSNNITIDDVINGTIVFDNTEQTVRTITARPSNNTLTVSPAGGVSSANVSVYYPGLSVDNTGNVSIGNTATAYSKFYVQGSIGTNITSKSGDYTLTHLDNTLLGNSSGGLITITLPNTSGIGGRIYKIVKIDSSGNAVKVSASGSDTINGSTFINLASQYKFIEVVGDGSSNWYITSSNI